MLDLWSDLAGMVTWPLVGLMIDAGKGVGALRCHHRIRPQIHSKAKETSRLFTEFSETMVGE